MFSWHFRWKHFVTASPSTHKVDRTWNNGNLARTKNTESSSKCNTSQVIIRLKVSIWPPENRVTCITRVACEGWAWDVLVRKIRDTWLVSSGSAQKSTLTVPSIVYNGKFNFKRNLPLERTDSGMFSFLLWEKASVVLNFFFPLTRSSFSSSFFMALFCFSVCSLSFVISWKLVKFPIMIHVLAKLQFRVIHIILLKFIYSFPPSPHGQFTLIGPDDPKKPMTTPQN